MNERQQRFVNEYCIDLNAKQAAIRAGYSKDTAQELGCRLLTNIKVKAAVDERLKDLSIAAGISVQWVLRQWYEIANADPNDLMQLRRVNCRHCYGSLHFYQWTMAEYQAAVNIAIERGKPAPDGMGGFGYDVNKEPNPNCPECGGLGEELLHVADTRHLKGPARRLYAGVQRTKEGLKILTRDQDGALLQLAKYLGMLVDKKEISGPGGAPISFTKADELTDDQLAAILKMND